MDFDRGNKMRRKAKLWGDAFYDLDCAQDMMGKILRACYPALLGKPGPGDTTSSP